MDKPATIKELEKYMRSQTPTAQKTRKSLVGLSKAIEAANVVNGRFAEFAKTQPSWNGYVELEAKLFETYEAGGLENVLLYSRDWR